MAQNMYRVGDYVYFETSSSAPYQIRKIEELNKTSAGNVEAKVLCYYRRREIPKALLKIADKAERIDDRSLINTRRHINMNSSRTPKINGDIKNEALSDEESSSTHNERNEKTSSSTAAPAQREESDSPKPMQVDVGEDENDDSKADKSKGETSQGGENDDEEEEDLVEGGYGLGGLPKGSDSLTPRERHHLRQHELFLSRQIESLPATHIRGKCSVTLLSEVETPDSYLGREDAFFYSLVYDQSAMTLLADKGEIRVGEKFQCEVPDDVDPEAVAEVENKVNGNLVIAEEEDHGEPVISTTEREVLVYHPFHNLTDRDIDQFLIIARQTQAVGTFSRALDTSSSVKLPSLHMTAAAASRDVTLLHAMALLHQANYDLGQAVKYLVPPPSKQHYPLDADKTTSHNTVSLGGPILCRDQMEEWSAAEANLFEEAIDKYQKDFNDIRADFLPWKSIRDIIEYYYMWKTTNRYVELKKNKAIDQESKLKQVYIPNYNKPNPNLVGPPNASGQPLKGTTPCESCQTLEAMQWYAWGPAQMQMRLCSECWTWWKKNGGLKRVHKLGKKVDENAYFFKQAYDLDGTTTQDMLNPGQQASGQKTQSNVLNATGLSRGSSAAVTPTARNGGIVGKSSTGGQVVARLPQQQQVLIQQKTGTGANLQVSVTPSNTSTPKTRVAFFLHTTLPIRIARRLAPKSLLNIRRSARRPFLPINGQAIRQHCATRQPIEIIRAAKQLKRNKLSDVMLAQIAAVLTSSGAHAAQAANLKRPLSAADKSHVPNKRQLGKCHLLSSGYMVVDMVECKPGGRSGDVKQPLAPMVPLPNMPLMVPSNLAAFATLFSHPQLPRQFAAAAAAAPLKPPGTNTPLISGAREVASVAPVRRQPDSRYVGVDEKLLFLAGPRLNLIVFNNFSRALRKRICTKRTARRIALHPCNNSDFINKQLPSLQSLFT
uniref:Metastasis-associated protein MTA3 n=1 Tax=Syphacia muris TaxID=451379 RepID=A0A0N5AUV2_9BILA